MKKISFALISLLILSASLKAQNIAITDNDGYTAHSSAMLDVYSTNKGLLIPRLTSSQRNSISNPETSLMVFDVEVGSYFYWSGSIWKEVGTTANDHWLENGSSIYYNGGNVGIGTNTPGRKMIVKGDSNDPNEAIFAIQNNSGDTVFAVYPEGVRVWFNDSGTKAAGNRGGFAVGGFSPAKSGLINEYLRVTQDSVRIYIDDDYLDAKATGSKGGFAVGGFSTSKGELTDNYLFVQDDSSRVYVKGDEGFAIDNIETGNEARYMDLTPDNYFIGHQAGLNTTPNYIESLGLYNQFIGYQSGYTNTEGKNNIFMGYHSGYGNIYAQDNIFIGVKSGYQTTGTDFMVELGGKNVFIGNQAGYSNKTGYANVCIGDEAGFSLGNSSSNDEAYSNVFIGESAGRSNDLGVSNVFLGSRTGYDNIDGSYNVYIGKAAFANNTSGEKNVSIGRAAGYWQSYGNNNVYLGFEAGYGSSSLNHPENNNVFIGYQAGKNLTGGSNMLIIENSSAPTSDALIFGQFDNDILRFNAKVGVDRTPVEKLDINGGIRIGSTTNNNPGTIRWTGTDFEGYNGASWVSLTSGVGGSDTDWTIIADDMYSGVTGNVGIGYTSPTYKLDVNGNTRIDGRFYITSGDSWDKLEFAYETGGYSYLTIYDGSTNDDIKLATLSDSWIAGSGNVGIGTKTPSTKLEVNGDISVQDDDWVGIGAAAEKISFDADQEQIELLNASVGIQTSTPNSGLHINTSMAKAFSVLSSGTTLTENHNVVTVSAKGTKASALILPDPAPIQGRQYTLINTGVPFYVDPNGSAINGSASSIPLDDNYEYVTVISDGNQWLIISHFFN